MFKQTAILICNGITNSALIRAPGSWILISQNGPRAAFLSGLYVLIYSLCIPTSSQMATAAPITSEDLSQKGAVRLATVWRWNDDNEPKKIHVCWENIEESSFRGRSIVRNAIELTWQEYTKLEFWGWSQCAEKSSGIRILIADVSPQLRYPYLGNQIDGLPRGMILNFSFKNFASGCTDGDIDIWIARIAVHEFGHAIGFTHEQNRTDTPDTCKAIKQGTTPDKNMTVWDEKSIMNYCYCTGNAELSPLDIEAAQSLYGRR